MPVWGGLRLESTMQLWIVEADIYRFKKAMLEANEDERSKIAWRLRRAEGQLAELKQRVAG
jgi:hypothetical protein